MFSALYTRQAVFYASAECNLSGRQSGVVEKYQKAPAIFPIGFPAEHLARSLNRIWGAELDVRQLRRRCRCRRRRRRPRRHRDRWRERPREPTPTPGVAASLLALPRRRLAFSMPRIVGGALVCVRVAFSRANELRHVIRIRHLDRRDRRGQEMTRRDPTVVDGLKW